MPSSGEHVAPKCVVVKSIRRVHACPLTLLFSAIEKSFYLDYEPPDNQELWQAFEMSFTRRPALRSSDRDPLDLIERDLIARAVI